MKGLISTPGRTQTEDKKNEKSRENLDKKGLKMCAVTTKQWKEHISSFAIKICEPNSTYSWHSWGQLSEAMVLSPYCQQQRPHTLELSSAWHRLFPTFCTINTTGEGKRKRRTLHSGWAKGSFKSSSKRLSVNSAENLKKTMKKQLSSFYLGFIGCEISSA